LRTPFEKGEIFGVVEVGNFVVGVSVSCCCSGDLVKVVVEVVNMVGAIDVGGGVGVGVGVKVMSMALTSMVKKRFFMCIIRE
jgi:hypothetical protein